jgi:hypothetical protein
MIPSRIYNGLDDTQQHELNLMRIKHLEWVKDWSPEVARIASDRITSVYQKNPELNIQRSILESYMVLAMCYKSGETELTEQQFNSIKSVLDYYGVT